MATTDPAAPVTENSVPKQQPESSTLSTASSTTAPQTTTTTATTPSFSQSGTDHNISASANTTHANSETPISPSSTTPVPEKEELDFVGNVDVNDALPTETDLKRVEDMLLLDAQGASRPFKELYSGAGVAPRQLIIFVRHFFCGNCQEYLRTLSSSITPESLIALPTPTFITVIGCGRPELIDMYLSTTSCPFPVYADPTHKLYDYLGMTRTLNLGKKPNYIHSNLFVTSVQSIVQSLRTGDKALKGGDLKQVGGEFLFENGQVTWVHRMRNTRDHAEIEEVRRVLGLDDKKPPMRKRWSHAIKETIPGNKRSSSWGRVRSKSKTQRDRETEGAGTTTPEGTKEEEEEEEEEEDLRALEEDRKLSGKPTV